MNRISQDVEASFDGELGRFRRYLESERRSPQTVQAYIAALERYVEFAKQRGMPLGIEAISGEHIREFIIDMRNRGNSEKTIALRLSGLRAFFRWLIDSDELVEEKSPMKRIKQPRVQEKIPPVVTEKELETIFGALTKDKSFEGVRDLAILRVMLSTGARSSELLGLMLHRDSRERESDVDLDQRVLYVMGKGGKPRPITLSNKASVALDNYLRRRSRHKNASRDELWITDKGAMTRSALYQMIRSLGIRLGIKNLHPHRLRHTWAHEAKTRGASEEDIMTMAGWSTPTMMRRYAKSTAQERAMATARRLNIGDDIG